MEKLIKITFCIGVTLLAATFIFIVVAYCDSCEDRKNTIYNLWLEIEECKEELKPYQEAETLYEDDEFKAIKVLK